MSFCVIDSLVSYINGCVNQNDILFYMEEIKKNITDTCSKQVRYTWQICVIHVRNKQCDKDNAINIKY